MQNSLDYDLPVWGFWRRSSGKQILELSQCVLIFLGSTFTGFYLKAVVERRKSRTNVSFTVLFCLSPLTLPSPPAQGHHLAVLSHCSHVRLCDPMSVARQAPLCTGFFRQEYWSGLPCPPPGDLPNPGIKPELLCLLHRQAGSLPLASLINSKHSSPPPAIA